MRGCASCIQRGIASPRKGSSMMRYHSEAPARPNRAPNIRIRPDCARVGRIQRQIRRLLIIQGDMTTGELARSIYSRPTLHWQRRQVREAARKFAVESHRRRSAGLPIVWQLKTSQTRTPVVCPLP
jgi:hypothetical protein